MRSGASAPSVPLSIGREERDWIQVLASTFFLLLAGYLIALQARNSLDLADAAGVLGAREGRTFIVVYAGVVLAIGLMAAFLPRRLLWAPIALGGLALATAVLAVATAGGEIWSMAVAVLSIAAAWILGRAALGLPWLRKSALRSAPMPALVVGLWLLGMIVFCLGLVGGIRWWTVGLLVVVAGGVAVVKLGRAPWSGLTKLKVPDSRFQAGALGILGLQGAFATIWAAAPDVQFDALQYKAWLPTLWAETGRIDAETFRDNPISTYLGLGQLVATPGHTIGAEAVGRFLQLFLVVLIVAVVWKLGSRVNGTVAAIAGLAVALTPHVVWQASTAYDDILLSFMVLGSALAVLHFEGRRVAHPLAVSVVVGFLAGACVTGKLHLIPFCIGLFATWCLIARDLKDFFTRAGGFAAGAFVSVLPPMLYRQAEFGNPVYPFYNQVFQSESFPTETGITTFSSLTQSGGARPGWDFVRDLVTLGLPDKDLAAPGVFGLLIPMAGVALLFGWRGNSERRAVWGALLIGLLLWWIQFRYMRFALPYAICCVAVALPFLGGLDRLIRVRLLSVLAVAAAAIAAAAFVVSSMASLWNVPGRFPLRAAVGAESSEAYRARALGDYAAIQYLNAHAEPGRSIVGGELWGRLLLRDDLRLQLDFELARLVGLGSEPRDAADLRRRMQERGFDWVALTDVQRQYSSSYFLAPVLDRYGQIRYADGLRDVYEIVDEPASSAPVALCDGAFAQPSCWFGAVPLDDVPGLTSTEVQGQPIGQEVPVCAGATYKLVVNAGPGVDAARVFFVFDVANPRQEYRQGDVYPSSRTVLYQTAPPGATSLSIVVQPLGPNVVLDSMELAIANQPAGSACP